MRFVGLDDAAADRSAEDQVFEKRKAPHDQNAKDQTERNGDERERMIVEPLDPQTVENRAQQSQNAVWSKPWNSLWEGKDPCSSPFAELPPCVPSCENMQPYMRELVHDLFLRVEVEQCHDICKSGALMNSVSIMSVISINPLVLHSVLFATQSYYVFRRLGASSSCADDRRAQFHLIKVLRLLQRTLEEDNQETRSDATMVSIIFLAIVGFCLDDGEVARHHVEGLAKIVALRGGLQNIGLLRVQLCRVDLGAAIASGLRPVFYKEALSWPRHFNELVELSNDLGLKTLLSYLDSRLISAWLDLRFICRTVNRMQVPSPKYENNEYHESMISILYRLLHLDYKPQSPDEPLRLSAATFAVMIFLQHRENIFLFPRHISDKLQAAIARLPSRHESKAPMQKVVVWMLFMAAMAYGPNKEGAHHLLPQLKARLQGLGVKSWAMAKGILKGLLWIDYMHDPAGLYFYEASMKRKGS